ncbi:unnamed protein product [Euphydryas editha]|uniref:Peptidase S1 domain-containing protein n=1 Tax=Euphydryas editha TaxID=104508 RepID=A0AAU9TF80_EUPED|nr:unnamed protein product [Euphydryas editha]
MNFKGDVGSETEDETPNDNYLFVALIDIVFTDGSKRTCTGTIIHDNVVITAAHCFFKEDSIQPELTASFVVIGTKKMFDSGYEQYLPIERIITHPNYRGWESDLALVYTFAGMMSDKPGRVVRLATEKTSTDFEVNVFSWGQCQDEECLGLSQTETEMPCSDDDKVTQLKPYRNNQKMYEISKLDSQEYRVTTEKTRQIRKRKKNLQSINKESVEADKRKQRRQAFKMMSYYRNNWRRNRGDQINKLTVGIFTFLNTQTCKKLIEKAMASFHKMKNTNEVLCYTSEENYVTKEDSGAPAMRLGRLVAVTVGGVDFDGERVAIGLNIVCFCSWIAENLPKSDTRIQCCRNCCETKDNENLNGERFKHTHKKKKHRNDIVLT